MKKPSYEARIDRAIANAGPMPQVDNDNEFAPWLQGKPDSYRIKFKGSLEEDPNGVMVETEEELRLILGLISQRPGWELRHSQITDLIEHEKAHYLSMPAKRLAYQMRVYEDADRRLRVTTEGTKWATTKLGVAASLAAPLQPSHYDLSTLRDMGYSSRAEVRSRIIAHNAQSLGKLLPVPKDTSENSFWAKCQPGGEYQQRISDAIDAMARAAIDETRRREPFLYYTGNYENYR